MIPNLLFGILRTIAFTLISPFIRKVTNKENIPKKGPLIIVANHDSYLDPFIIYHVAYSSINQKIYFLTMKGRFWDKFGDKVSRGVGCIPLDEGKENALKEMEKRLKEKKIVALFPGGPRSLDGTLPQGRTGVVRLALATNSPILPIGIIGAYEIAPRDKLIPKLKRCEAKIGKPIYFKIKKKITKKLLHSLTDKVMLEIAKLSKKKYRK